MWVLFISQSNVFGIPILFRIRTPTVLVCIMYQFDLHFFKPQDSIRRPVWDGYLDRIVRRTQKTFLWKSFSQRLRFLHYFGKFRMCCLVLIPRKLNIIFLKNLLWEFFLQISFSNKKLQSFFNIKKKYKKKKSSNLGNTRDHQTQVNFSSSSSIEADMDQDIKWCSRPWRSFIHIQI